MRDHPKARPFAGAPSGAEGGMAASIAELTSLSLFAPPCCGHIALCDGACGDARPTRGDWREAGIGRIGGDTR